jgi:DNA repair exonuclease SbcCD nuclease subunit
VERIRGLQAQYNCPVVHAGDLFHHWKPSPGLLSQALWFLPKEFYTIYGQHDLPQHNWELRSKSGLHTLQVAGAVKVLQRGHYGQEPENALDSAWLTGDTHYLLHPEKKILVWHHLTYITAPFPGAKGGNAQSILRKYPGYDLIVTGDNHQSFYTEYEGRLLVNPGPITRQKADQIDFQPRVALWYADTNTITWVNLPMQEGVISREHIEVKEQRDARIDAFISKLDGDWQVEMSFEDNLRNFFAVNNTKESIQQIIYKAIE